MTRTVLGFHKACLFCRGSGGKLFPPGPPLGVWGEENIRAIPWIFFVQVPLPVSHPLNVIASEAKQSPRSLREDCHITNPLGQGRNTSASKSVFIVGGPGENCSPWGPRWGFGGKKNHRSIGAGKIPGSKTYHLERSEKSLSFRWGYRKSTSPLSL